MNVLIVIDMQHDFIDGTLGSPQAQAIVPVVREKICNFTGPIVFTRDTHDGGYLESQEGKHLPVEHCARGTKGWEIADDLLEVARERGQRVDVLDKPNFGSLALLDHLKAMHEVEPIETITMVGLCTDICVVSNALILKAGLPEVPLHVDPKCCAGVTQESHDAALLTMKMCQCIVEE